MNLGVGAEFSLPLPAEQQQETAAYLEQATTGAKVMAAVAATAGVRLAIEATAAVATIAVA